MKKNKTLLMAIPILIILVGLIIYQYGFLRIQESLAAIKEEQDIKAKTLQKYLAIIAERPDLEKRLNVLKEQRKAEASKLIEESTFSLAAANLQETVKAIILSRGGVISSERVGKEEDILPVSNSRPKEESKGQKREKEPKSRQGKSEEKRRFKSITVSFDFTAQETGVLRDIIFFIETKTPFLVIKELDCRIKNLKEPRELMVKLDVSALYGGK
jgi:hypothetical protein